MSKHDDYFTKIGDMNNPLVVLGQLRADVGYLKQTGEETKTTVQKIAADIDQMRLERAGVDGQKKVVLRTARFAEIMITLIAAIATAWGTVKAMASSLPLPHG